MSATPVGPGPAPSRAAGHGAADEAVESSAVHSLAWLVAGNAAGLLLSLLLLWPGLGGLLAPLTFGRWVPVHLDTLLYGWGSLPLVGILFRMYLPRGGAGRWPGIAVGLWSGAVLVGVVSWLGGHQSGKPFLDWAGPSRGGLVVAMVFLFLVLAAAYTVRVRRGEEAGRAHRATVTRIVLKGIFLMALGVVPAVLYVSESPAVYPPINPESGGPTGVSLLGSTLGIVAIFCLFPFMAGLRTGPVRPPVATTFWILAAHFAAFLLADHGNHSHREAVQILALGSLLPWPLLLARLWRRFEWPEGARPWILATAAWGSGLVVTAFTTFLPGVLDRLKFTNALVGHAHAAMAGLVTSFTILVLVVLLRGTRLEGILSRPLAYRLWQGGAFAFVASLLLLGGVEALEPGRLYAARWETVALYALRGAAGAVMFAASTLWLVPALGRVVAGKEAGGVPDDLHGKTLGARVLPAGGSR